MCVEVKVADTREERREDEGFGDPRQFEVPCPSCGKLTDELEDNMCFGCIAQFTARLEEYALR